MCLATGYMQHDTATHYRVAIAYIISTPTGSQVPHLFADWGAL